MHSRLSAATRLQKAQAAAHHPVSGQGHAANPTNCALHRLCSTALARAGVVHTPNAFPSATSLPPMACSEQPVPPKALLPERNHMPYRAPGTHPGAPPHPTPLTCIFSYVLFRSMTWMPGGKVDVVVGGWRWLEVAEVAVDVP